MRKRASGLVLTYLTVFEETAIATLARLDGTRSVQAIDSGRCRETGGNTQIGPHDVN